MHKFFYFRIVLGLIFISLILFLMSCGQLPANSNVVSVNSNTNTAVNSNVNSLPNTNSSNVSSSAVETKEPNQYQAKINLKFQATGTEQKTELPMLSASLARDGEQRRMEFSLPNGEKAIYLNKTDGNYLVLPNHKQYAILDRQALGFEIRQLMTPAEIINRIKNTRGVERVGEENFNGRQVVRYRYGAVTNTQTNAGQVSTESFFLVDKETGLPLHSETVSASQSGNVQGYNGLRIVTDMTDVSATAPPELFTVPTDYQKIDAEQVKAQANLIFNTVALFLNQAMKSAQTNSNTNSANTAASPSSTR